MWPKRPQNKITGRQAIIMEYVKGETKYRPQRQDAYQKFFRLVDYVFPAF